MWESIDQLATLILYLQWGIFAAGVLTLALTALSLKASSRKDELQGQADLRQREQIARMELQTELLRERNLRLERDLAERFAPRELSNDQKGKLRSTLSKLQGLPFELYSIPDWESSNYADAIYRLFKESKVSISALEVVPGAAVGLGIITAPGEEVPHGAKILAEVLNGSGLAYYTTRSDLVARGKFALAVGQKPTGPLEAKAEY